MNQTRFRSNPYLEAAPAIPPQPVSASTNLHGGSISQYVTGGQVPDRLKTNEEWVTEANAAADAAAAAVIRKATVQRLHVLHENIVGYVAAGNEAPLELLEEYGTLAGV